MELIQFCSNRVHLGDHDLGPLLDGLRTPTDYVLAGEGQSIYKACQLYLWCTSGRFGDLMRSMCCVLGQSTLLSQIVCLHSGVLRGSWELLRKPDEMLGGILATDWYPIQGGLGILLVSS